MSDRPFLLQLLSTFTKYSETPVKMLLHHGARYNSFRPLYTKLYCAFNSALQNVYFGIISQVGV